MGDKKEKYLRMRDYCKELAKEAIDDNDFEDARVFINRAIGYEAKATGVAPSEEAVNESLGLVDQIKQGTFNQPE